MNKRVYQFILPYTVSSIQIEFGIGQLKSDGIFQGLPAELQHRLQTAADQWNSLTVTTDDLDKIPDPVWQDLANRLGLQWHEIPSDAERPSHKTVIGTTSSGIAG